MRGAFWCPFFYCWMVRLWFMLISNSFGSLFVSFEVVIHQFQHRYSSLPAIYSSVSASLFITLAFLFVSFHSVIHHFRQFIHQFQPRYSSLPAIYSSVPPRYPSLPTGYSSVPPRFSSLRPFYPSLPPRFSSLPPNCVNPLSIIKKIAPLIWRYSVLFSCRNRMSRYKLITIVFVTA